METAADVGGTRPPAQARPGGPEPREAADARGDQIVHGAPGDPAHRRPVRRLLCCPPGLWPQGCRGCGSSRGGRGRRTCQDEARGAGSEEGRGAVWAGGARGAGGGSTVDLAGGGRLLRGPAAGVLLSLQNAQGLAAGNTQRRLWDETREGGAACPHFPAAHGPQSCTGQGGDSCGARCQVTRTRAAPTAWQTPAGRCAWRCRWSLRPPAARPRARSPHTEAHTQPLRLRRVKASSLGGSRPRPSVPLPCRRQTVQFGTGSVDTPDTASRGGQGRDPIVCPSEGVRPAGSHASRNSVAAARDF